MANQTTPGFLLSGADLVSGTALGTFSLGSVPAGNYDLFLYGANFDGTRGAAFTVSSGTPLGGFTSTTNPNNWAWVTGAPWTAFDASNFAPGEPNGDSEGLTMNRYGNSTWNDEGTEVGGYIVEVRGVPDACSTQMLLVGACGMIGAVGRKFRKQ